MISPEAVEWAKPRISQILGVPIQKEEVESILGLENDEEICRHLASFSEDPSAYIHATDFVKQYRREFVHGSLVTRPVASPKKAAPVRTTTKSLRVTYKNEDEMDQMFQESLLEGMVVVAPRVTGPRQPAVARRICGCMGLDHAVSRNCISCGRVLCVEEADPACVVCGFGGNAKVDKKTFQEYKEGEGYVEAVALMQKLLSFDKDSASRTRVYDTQTDFYEERYNPWCTESERQVTAAYSDRQEAVYNDPTKLLSSQARLEIDLENLKLSMSDVQQEFVQQQNEALQKYLAEERGRVTQLEQVQQAQAKRQATPSLPLNDEQWLLDSTALPSSTTGALKTGENWQLSEKPKISEEQPPSPTMPSVDLDVAFSEESAKSGSDRGVCLTLHQPWASLIVYGLKRIEGRVWTTEYRGRLWIHAAAQEPEPERIAQMEAYYSTVYPDDVTRPKLPPCYPTRCLVGCVELVDIVTEHRGLWDRYPWIVEVNDSPYKFILRNPQRLLTPIPMPGEHKLWQLHKPSVYHRALVKQKFAKVSPAHIDNSDPLSTNQDFVDALRSERAPAEATTIAPWEVVTRHQQLREQLLVPLPPTVTETITVATRKPLRLTSHISAIINALDPQISLRAFCGAVCLSLERAFDAKSAAWASAIGEPNEKIAEHLRLFWKQERALATAQIHPAIRRVAEAVLSQTSTTDGARGYSLGGPHLPPMDVLELHLSEPTSETLATPFAVGVGEPLLIIGLSGTHVLTQAQSAELFVSAGDVLVVHRKSIARQLNVARTQLMPEDDPLLASCALVILRCNLYL